MLLTCVFAVQMYYAFPKDKTYMDQREFKCKIRAIRGPHDIGDKRTSVLVDCKDDMDKYRIHETEPFKRMGILNEDCF